MIKAGLEIIPQFNIKYPEYSIVTPHTLMEYTIRSLKVSEEETLKSSLLTQNRLSEHLNKIIYSCLVNKPASVISFESFLAQTSIRDRDALTYALYHVTYKDVHNYDVTCSKCQNNNTVKIKFSESFKMTPWDKSPVKILDVEVPVKLDIASNVTCILRQPSLADESGILAGGVMLSDADMEKMSDVLPIKRFEITTDEMVKQVDPISDRNNILQIYNDLPSPDRKLIDKAYSENFGKYSINLSSIVICQSCGYNNDTEIDLVRQFFRSIYE